LSRPMPLDISRVRAILLEVPRHGKLAYCLLRDPRVPTPPKLALLAALGVVVSPLDFPGWIPILGDFDMLALGILAVKVFVDACPKAIVEEHRQALKAGESRFDEDLRGLVGAARLGTRRTTSRISELVIARQRRSVEDRTA
jgi:uncharacterized membrane protein YkvA (DUF1232 family)